MVSGGHEGENDGGGHGDSAHSDTSFLGSLGEAAKIVAVVCLFFIGGTVVATVVGAVGKLFGVGGGH